MWYFIIIGVLVLYLILRQQYKTEPISEPPISKAELNIEIYRLAKKRKLLLPITTSVYEVQNPSSIPLDDYEMLKKEILCKKN